MHSGIADDHLLGDFDGDGDLDRFVSAGQMLMMRNDGSGTFTIDPLALPAGTYDLKITTPGGGTTLIDPVTVAFGDGDIFSVFAVGDGSNQPLGVFAWLSDQVGFLLPLMRKIYIPFVPILAVP